MDFKSFFCFIIIACLVNAQMKFPTKMLNKLKEETSFESILILKNSSLDCWMDLDLNMEYATPIIKLNANQKYMLKNQYNKRFLALVWLLNQTDPVLKALYANLAEIRESATVFFVNHPFNISALFENCYENKMLNVLAMGNWSDQYIYSYRAFPGFKLLRRNMGGVERLLEPQLKDLAGHPLVTMVDNVFPRTVVYSGANGSRQLAGYLMPFVENFARSLNATLRIHWDHPLEDREILKYSTVRRLVRTDRVDVAAILMSTILLPNYLTSSQVLEITQWQLMLPVEPQVNCALLVFAAANSMHILLAVIAMWMFALLLHNAQRLELGQSPSYRCLFVFADPVLRAILLQSFVLPRILSLRRICIYFLLLIFSVQSTNVYLAQLEMLLVHPFKQPAIRNYQDMRRAGLKVLLTGADRQSMILAVGKQALIDNWDVHWLVNSSQFQEMRSQPNTSYAYPITQTLWPLIQHKFARQKRSAFRLSQDFTFLSLVPFAIPMSRNSIFGEVLNRYVLTTHASGLYDFWRRRSFYDLVAIGQFEELPYESYDAHCNLGWEVFVYFILAYIYCIGVCLVIFILELGLHAVQRWRRNK